MTLGSGAWRGRAFVAAVERPQHRWPGLPDGEIPRFWFHFLVVITFAVEAIGRGVRQRLGDRAHAQFLWLMAMYADEARGDKWADGRDELELFAATFENLWITSVRLQQKWGGVSRA
jgi:hypothetical protein